MSEILLEVKDIDVYYGLFQAIRKASINIKRGQTAGLFGPNGHGKTTIIKAISGIQNPSQGKILFEGKEIQDYSTEQIVDLGVIQVPQEAHLFPDMTVKENLLLGAYSKKAWPNRFENIQTVHNLFPRLEERENQLARTLSGGERQMVALGRGLMAGAKLLMLDEPSIGLSPIATEDLLFKIKDIKELGITILLVEQNITFVTELCDYLYLIESAEVKLEGSTDDVLEKKEIVEAYLGRKF
ncbi:ABC transporter ATP-binding protein [Thermoproteota archaeon]